MTILRLRFHRGSRLPHQKQRNRSLNAIHPSLKDGFVVSYLPGGFGPLEILSFVKEEIREHDVGAIEIDFSNKMLRTVIAIGVWLKTFRTDCGHKVEVYCPKFSLTGKFVCHARLDGLALVLVDVVQSD